MSGLVLLNAVTGTGASLAKEFSRLVDKHALQVVITGAPTAVTVALLGSLDGTTYSLIGTHAMSAGELTATDALYFDIDKPVLHVKASLTVLTGGTAPTVTITYEGDSTVAKRIGRRGQF